MPEFDYNEALLDPAMAWQIAWEKNEAKCAAEKKAHSDSARSILPDELHRFLDSGALSATYCEGRQDGEFIYSIGVKNCRKVADAAGLESRRISADLFVRSNWREHAGDFDRVVWVEVNAQSTLGRDEESYSLIDPPQSMAELAAWLDEHSRRERPPRPLPRSLADLGYARLRIPGH